MTSSLIFKAHYLNHLVNMSFLFVRFPLKWSRKKHCWHLHQPKNIFENYYIKIAVAKLGATLVLFSPFLWHTIFPDKLQQQSLIALFLTGMMFILLIATSIVDLVCYLDLAEVLQCCNWGYRQIGLRTSPKNQYLQKFELQQGLLTLCFVFGYTAFAFLASLCLVYSDMDPLLAILKIGLQIFRIKSLPDVVLYAFKLFRYISICYFALLCVVSLRTLSICGIVGGFYRGELLFWMSRQTLNFQNISLYRQAAIVQKVMNSFDYKASTATFGLAFNVILFGVYVCILGQVRNNSMLIGVGAIGILGGCELLQFFFLVGCAYYTNSVLALEKWRLDLGRNGPNRYFRRVIKSLKPVAMPAGEVGIIDQDIKINYSDKLLEYVVDVVISTNEIM